MDLSRLTDFLHEAGQLRHTPRSGYQFLGSGTESVAEHSHRAAIIGYALARLVGADPARTAMICLFHDLGEARTGDMNYVNKRYCVPREREALSDALSGTPFSEILDFYDAHAAATQPDAPIEAQLAHDADQLDLLLNLQREFELGNPQAATWMDAVSNRLLTVVGRELAPVIRSRPHTAWWFATASEK